MIVRFRGRDGAEAETRICDKNFEAFCQRHQDVVMVRRGGRPQ